MGRERNIYQVGLGFTGNRCSFLGGWPWSFGLYLVLITAVIVREVRCDFYYANECITYFGVKSGQSSSTLEPVISVGLLSTFLLNIT